jgi:predicted house-cleaning NTP pyrophosphatase (Maf/HAM1 superfamily)
LRTYTSPLKPHRLKDHRDLLLQSQGLLLQVLFGLVLVKKEEEGDKYPEEREGTGVKVKLLHRNPYKHQMF